TSAERRVDDQLHPAAVVEEALEDQRVFRRYDAEHRPASGEVLHRLPRRVHRDAGLGSDELDGVIDPFRRAVAELAVDGRAEPGHRRRELARATRSLTEPERDGRRLPASIFDPHRARFDPQDLPRGVAELEDVALHALDGEIFVDGSDTLIGRIDDDL